MNRAKARIMNKVQQLYIELQCIGYDAISKGGTSPYHHLEADEAMKRYKVKDFTEEEIEELERLLDIKPKT